MSNLNSGYLVIELNTHNKKNEILKDFIKKNRSRSRR